MKISRLISAASRLQLAVIACSCFLLVFSTGTAQAAANCSITTVPTPPTITEGGSVDFTGSVSGKSPKTYSWTFEGGTDDGMPNGETETVSYPDRTLCNPVGSCTATLMGTNGKGDMCQASVDVTVNAGGGGGCTRNAPTFSMGADQAIDANGSAVYTLSVTNNDTAACPGTTFAIAIPIGGETGDVGSFVLPSSLSAGSVTVSPQATDTTVTLTVTGNGTGADADALTSTVSVSDATNHNGQDQSDSVTTTITVAAATPVARGDAYATPVGKTLEVTATRVSGLLYNDFGGTPPLSVLNNTNPINGGSVNVQPDGSFTYTPPPGLGDNANDTFDYTVEDNDGNTATATVNINILSDQPDFKIMMNYELGMHCTGFEFAYCCVLPPYNSILAQVVKPQATANPDSGDDFPRLLESSHDLGRDLLGRPTVVQAGALNGNNYQTYMLEYFHDAQPRRENHGATQNSTRISAAEGNSLFYTSTIFDSAQPIAGNLLDYGAYEGADGVIQGSGTIGDQPATDNYANGWLNHFYIYADPDTGIPNLEGHGKTGQEADKFRLGVAGQVEYPVECGAGLHPLGPVTSQGLPIGDDPNMPNNPLSPNTCNGFSNGNVLTFSGDTGTVVYTQSKVLEDLPVMLTSPGIWEALGLPLTPFEDTIDFFGDLGPGSVDEDSIRPYVAMKAKLYEANCDQDPLSGTYGECTKGDAVTGSNGHPVIGFGTAPIDIPNCERCHSVTDGSPNSPSTIRTDFAFRYAGNGGLPAGDLLDVNMNDSLASITDAEYQFWLAYYGLMPQDGQGNPLDSDWYPRLKGAAINMLALHDYDQFTGFTMLWPANDDTNPATNPVAQNTRLGKESVICQKCHADNVIAVVRSATKGGTVIKPISEALHWRHREVTECDNPNDPSTCGTIDFADAAGRSGGCQGCHPAHRSDGVMDRYPITLGGDNVNADGDNRLAAGGCFVGRDVHSNPLKDVDGAETPEHLNAVGRWLSTRVFNETDADGRTRGLWCTNCHTQLGQEMWKAEDCHDLIQGNCVENVRGGEVDAGANLGPVVDAINAALNTSYSVTLAESWLDPKGDGNDADTDPDSADGIDHTHRIWDPATTDALVAVVELSGGVPVSLPDDDLGPGKPSGPFNINILSFCTTADCVDLINNNKDDPSAWRYPEDGQIDGQKGFVNIANDGVALPFGAATDGRDHWLSPGEPHCADCHAAPYVEQTGNNNPYPPFNYPAKVGLMRYSKGHQGISCQGCHESIHGLYPVSPTIDATSYAQAAALNADGSHGPIKCAACHAVNASGVPSWMKSVEYNGGRIRSFDDAVGWAHTFTRQGSVLTNGGACTNCHTYPKGGGQTPQIIEESNGGFLAHSYLGRVGRKVQDQAEIEALGHVAGDPDPDGIPSSGDERGPVQIAGDFCVNCHAERGGPPDAPADLVGRISCDDTIWKMHVFDGRVSEKVWVFMTQSETGGSTCGW